MECALIQASFFFFLHFLFFFVCVWNFESSFGGWSRWQNRYFFLLLFLKCVVIVVYFCALWFTSWNWSVGLVFAFCFRFDFFDFSVYLCFFLEFSLAFGSFFLVCSHFLGGWKGKKKGDWCIDWFKFLVENENMLDGFVSMYGCSIERCVDYNSLIDVFDLKNRVIWLIYNWTADKVCFWWFWAFADIWFLTSLKEKVQFK